jgi:hypothetical protein
VNIYDYFTFGMGIKDREWSNSSFGYTFGFQGQESENDVSGNKGGHSNYKYRMSDNRLGRFFAVDPLAPKYPWNSSYAFAENRVIDGIDLEGAEYLNYKALYHIVYYRKNTSNYTYSDVHIMNYKIHNVYNRISGTGLAAAVDHPSDFEEYTTSYKNAKSMAFQANMNGWISNKQVKNYITRRIGREKYNNTLKLRKVGIGLELLLEIRQVAIWSTNYLYDQKYAGELKYASQSAYAGHWSTGLVSKADNSQNMLPAFFSSSGTAKKDLVNFIIDGTTPEKNATNDDYIAIIKEWGELLYKYRDQIKDGTFSIVDSYMTLSDGNSGNTGMGPIIITIPVNDDIQRANNSLETYLEKYPGNPDNPKIQKP